ncbi:MAG: flagellar hook-basal body complex protein FliE [Candidatus Scalindua sp.]|nr:flagellar hook-basal body complex protein FliE [Candidatus Scalindua sp.]
MDLSTVNAITNKNIEKNFTKKIAQESGTNFKGTLGSVVNEVNDLQIKAGESIENFASGKIDNVHEVMIAMTKAEVSFKFMMETRNKLVSAYKEIMQMQV